MQLNSFGTILSFAEELEKKDEAFYSAALNNPECASRKSLFEQFLADSKKNQKNIQRTRRENVTEMILEGISDFTSDAFELEHGDPGDMVESEILDLAKKLENRAESYYQEAAQRIKALPEVVRALKMIGKKRTAHVNALAG